MKLSKLDIAEGLGMEYIGEYDFEGEYKHHFTIGRKAIRVGTWFDLDDAKNMLLKSCLRSLLHF